MEIKTKSGVVFLFDDNMGPLLSHLRIFANKKRGHNYARFRVSNGEGRVSRKAYVHRAIMSASRGTYVDHINGDTQDNRICNLRLCSNAENTRNKTVLNRKNTSGFSGVVWERWSHMWRAQIRFNGRQITIGQYAHKEDAIAARVNAEKEYFGDFAPRRAIPIQ